MLSTIYKRIANVPHAIHPPPMHVRTGIWILLLLGQSVGLGACGSGDSKGTGVPTAGATSPAGTGGALANGAGAGGVAAGTSGAGGNGAGSGGGAAAGGTGAMPTGVVGELRACLKYVRALCNHRNTCIGMPATDHPCPDDEALCPDLHFSKGSARTPEALVACADEVVRLGCDAPLGAPPCAVPGTRAAGEPCRFGSQCQSRACFQASPDAVVMPDCKTCNGLAPSLGDCSVPGTVCPSGESCSDGTCARNLIAPPPVAPVLQLGDRCPAGTACPTGSLCIIDPTDPTPTASAPLKCFATPSPGAACGVFSSRDDPSPWGRACGDDLYCADDDTCRVPPAIGAPCGVPYGTSFVGGANIGFVCADDAACLAGTCRAPGAAGEACGMLNPQPGIAFPCAPGVRCECNDASCATSMCKTVIAEGEACGQPNTVCEPQTTCTAGACASPGLQGLYEAACGL